MFSIVNIFIESIFSFVWQLNLFEIPKKIHFISEEFTCENGLLTPSMKNKRIPIAKKYEKELQSLFIAQVSSTQQRILTLASQALGQNLDSSVLYNSNLENLGADR